jgi:kynurenine formamidase
MGRRVIDLSQPLGRETQLHPFFPSVQILRQIVHTDAAPGKPSFSAEIIVTSNHAATHVDSFAHYDASPDAPRIAEMAVDTFCGEAICVDVRDAPRGHGVTPDELERAVAAGELDVRTGDILLFCTDHYNRTAGTPAFLDGFSGVDAATVHWMADRGVKIFGVETISPDLVYLTDEYPVHRACAERRLTHYENLNNLTEVVNRRFEFYGFPLKLDAPAAGSPVRAVAVVDD